MPTSRLRESILFVVDLMHEIVNSCYSDVVLMNADVGGSGNSQHRCSQYPDNGPEKTDFDSVIEAVPSLLYLCVMTGMELM